MFCVRIWWHMLSLLFFSVYCYYYHHYYFYQRAIFNCVALVNGESTHTTFTRGVTIWCSKRRQTYCFQLFVFCIEYFLRISADWRICQTTFRLFRGTSVQYFRKNSIVSSNCQISPINPSFDKEWSNNSLLLFNSLSPWSVVDLIRWINVLIIDELNDGINDYFIRWNVSNLFPFIGATPSKAKRSPLNPSKFIPNEMDQSVAHSTVIIQRGDIPNVHSYDYT